MKYAKEYFWIIDKENMSSTDIAILSSRLRDFGFRLNEVIEVFFPSIIKVSHYDKDAVIKFKLTHLSFNRINFSVECKKNEDTA